MRNRVQGFRDARGLGKPEEVDTLTHPKQLHSNHVTAGVVVNVASIVDESSFDGTLGLTELDVQGVSLRVVFNVHEALSSP